MIRRWPTCWPGRRCGPPGSGCGWSSPPTPGPPGSARRPASGASSSAEPVVRAWTDDGLPLELRLVNGLRLFGLLLCGLAAWPRSRRLAGVVALFLALFTSAMGDQAAIPYLLAALAVAGGVWLVLNHR